MASALIDFLVGGLSGVRNTSIHDVSDRELLIPAACFYTIPLLPGTRTMYKTSGSRTSWVGFRGYCGGLANKADSDDSERASTGAVMDEMTAQTEF